MTVTHLGTVDVAVTGLDGLEDSGLDLTRLGEPCAD